MRQKLYQAKCSAIAAPWLRRFLLNAFVRRVSRRMCMRMVRFCRSTIDVEIRSNFGAPKIGVFLMKSASRGGS